MEKERIVHKGNFQGKEVIFRYPTKNDLQTIWEYINTLSKERTYISFQGETISLEEEQKYLNSQLERISKHLATLLLAVCDGKVIGISGIDTKDKIEKHIGVFGISIAKDFRGEGIGSKLMELVIEEANNNLSGLEIITLGVFSINDLAKEIYKKFGFIEYGQLPRGIKLENVYSDHIYMYKSIKKQ